MDSTRRKKAQLAIDAIIRGLEFDHVDFAYDELEAALVPEGAYVQAAAHVERLAERTLDN
jgi:hypothetical protein